MVEKHKLFLGIVFIGFVLGILYTNLLASDYLAMTGVFSGYYLQAFAQTEVTMTECLPYIMKVRLLPLALLLLLAYSRINKVVVIIFLWWTGFLWGIYMSLGIAQLGFKGILFCLAGMFPQMIFYIPAYIIVLIFVYRCPESCWNALKVGVLVLCLISGIILECQVNAQIMKWMINMI